MRAAAGGSVARGSYGCTYCHNASSNTQMKGVLNNFTELSHHPMGETFTGFGTARGFTQNEYLSNLAADTSQPTNELDCLDCHDITLIDEPLDPTFESGHVKSVQTGTLLEQRRYANPYMLLNVTAAGQYDDFCRACHGSAAALVKGVNLRLDGLLNHSDASDAGANAIKESDGTALKTGAGANNKCSFCHEGHGSTGKKLFLSTMDPSNGTKCTDCHQNGDANNNFEAHGHGMNISSKGNALNFSCTACHAINNAHDPSDNSINAGNPKMLSYTAGTAPSKYGKSLTSICTNCHDKDTFTSHSGGGGTTVGCIDCHDEHAEGSGTGSNRFMIPQSLPNNYGSTELSFFQSTGDIAANEYDYWVANSNSRKTNPIEGAAMNAATNAGLCDNTICHDSGTPMNGQPLATFLNSGQHGNGGSAPAFDATALAAGVNCASCHTHVDGGGSWRAADSCTSCHGQPPVSQATSANGYVFSGTAHDEALTPHTRHVVDYGFECKQCHFDGTKHADGFFNSVYFDAAKNPSATGADYVDGVSPVCNNLYCHSDGQALATSNKDNVVWMTTSTSPNWNSAGNNLSCEACHGGVAVNASGELAYGAPDHPNGGSDTANSHAKHPYGCGVCHSGTTADTDPAGGWTLDLVGKQHVNGVKELLAGGGYTFTPNAPGSPRTCSNISCHGGNNATWGGAALSCDQCHFSATSDLNDFVNGNGTTAVVNSVEWGNAGHGRNTAFASLNPAANFVGPAGDLEGCLYCHDGAVTHGTATNPFRLRNKQTLAGSTNTAGNAFGWNDVCLVCHSTVDADGYGPAGYAVRNGTKNVNENHYGSKHLDASKGGTFCWDCHDPHGDAMAYMIQGTTGGAPGNGVTQTSAGSGSDYFGVPTVSRSVTGFDPTAGTGTPANFNSNDFTNAANTGLCQTCHTTAQHYNQSTNTALNGHNGADTNRCTSCHKHNGDFGASCSSCHGNGLTGQMWPDGANTQGDNATADNAGAHERHMEALAQRAFGQTTAQLLVDGTSSAKQKQLCEYCHAAVANDTDHGVNTNLPADVYVALMPASTRFAKNLQGTADADAAYAAGTYTCTNTDCHYKTTATPSWYLGQPAAPTAGTCTTCHNNGTDNGAIANAISTVGKHSQHGAAYTITTCNDCHNTFTPATMAAVATMATHMNANLYQVAIPNVAGAFKAQSAAVDPAYSGGAAGTCSGVSCHGGQAILWTAAAPACTNCHKAETPATEYNSASTGLHARVGSVSLENHTAADASVGDFTDSNACNHCHNAPTNHYVGLGTTAMDAVNNFVTTYNGTGGSITNTTCTVICHSDTNTTPNPDVPRWARKWSATVTNTDGTECLNCHGMWGNWVTGITHRSDAGPQNQHGSPQTSPTWGCDECHGLNSAQYDFAPKWAATAGDMHGDELIQVNSNSAANPLRLAGSLTGCDGCHSANDGTGALQHSFTTASRFGFQLIASANTYSGCTGCHGNAGTGQFWPDGAGGVPAYADSAAGAHDKHINAIGLARGWTTVDQKNQTCDWCHANPGNQLGGTYTGAPESAHSIDSLTDSIVDVIGDGRVTAGGATFYNNAATRVADANGAYNRTTKKCSNIDCHGGNQTPDWYNPVPPDTTPPYWPSGDGLVAEDSAVGGEVVVSWSAATDAVSLPIRYDLYRNATCTGSPIATATNLVATSFTDTGLVNNTAYDYCVRAKDAFAPYVQANNSVISTTPTSATPTLVVWTGGTTNMTYKLVSTTSAVSLGGVSTGVKVCGTRLNGTWPSTPPAFYTGLLVPDATAYTCVTASTNNAVLSNTSQTGNVFGVQHFLQNAYTKDTTVTGQNNAAGFDIWIDAGSTSATMLTYFARLSPAGVIDLTVGPLGSSTALSTTASRESANPQTLSILVPAGYRFGLVVGTNETTGSTFAPVLSLDNYNATVTNNASVMVSEVQTSLVETTPPVFPGPLSAVDAASGGTVNLSWPAGTDTSLPIRYRVWWSTGAINYGAAPNATTTATSLAASGLTNGVSHNFGVRAVDAQNNINTTQITATATPTPAPPPPTCFACHSWPQTSGAHTAHGATTNPEADAAKCSPCHGDVSGYSTGHSNAVLDLPAVAYSGEPTPGVLNGTCSSVSCHYGSLTPAWNSTGLLNCTSCHQYPPTTLAGAPGYSDHDAGLVMAGGVTEFKNAHDDCMGCHGVKSANTSGTGAMVRHANYPASMHGDGSVTMNGPDATPGPIAGTEYNDGNGGCQYACHGNGADANHFVTPSTYTPNVNYGNFGLGACTYCHQTGTFGAPAIPSAGAHAGSCDQCHPLHLVKSATTQVQIPNNTGVGINYATHGGIFLGGTGTKSAGWATANTPTEAEICWGCHDTQGISEWGVNNNAQTGGIAYNYGSVSTSNWRTATWTSGTALFGYKTAAIASTHAASTAGGAVKGVDPLTAIRCSYCHDVHDRNLAPGDTTSGQPYLRGSWRGNPYPEDGAPQTGSTYPAYNSTSNVWGAVPRGGPVAGTATGGFYIDQNSGNPVVTAGWTATQFGGLCDLCHGATATKNGVFTSAEVNTLNQYDAAGVGWVSGANGHVNSVGVAASGGGSHNATATTGGLNNQGNNIFAGRGGANSQTSSTASHPFMLFNGTSVPGDASGGFRGGDSNFRFTPAMGARPKDGTEWVGTQWNNLTGRTLALTGTTVDPLFHSFSCSKCHNPHASRLPALMITNCLDTRHNAWDNGFQLNSATDTLTLNRAISNWTSAQNCHRLGGVDTNAASPTYDSRADVSTVTTTPGNAGWNTVTPWQQ